MKTQKRVHSVEEMQAMIDNLLQLRQNRLDKAAFFRERADRLYKQHGCNGPDWDFQEHEEGLSEARDLRAKDRYYSKLAATARLRLEMYKAKLAVIQTKPFPGMLPDESILV